MNFSSLLSDHEQKAFSAFLGQLAQEERQKGPNPSPPGGTGDMSQYQLQHHVPHRQSQPQLPLSPSSLNGDYSRPLDSPSALAQQQREWIQQISSNPLLAPGGVFDPHAMSQAFLQDPALMAQASAIAQAMALAQQRQMQHQMEQLQQQQIRDQQAALQQRTSSFQQNQPIHDPYESQHQYHQSSPPSQYADQQQPYYPRNNRDPPVQLHTRTITKQKSQGSLHFGETDGHDSTPSPYSLNGVRHSSPRSYPSSPGGHYEPGYILQSQYPSQDDDDGFGPSAKKTAGRKGSSAHDLHRSSRDGHDPVRLNGKRKTSGSTMFDVNGRRNGHYTEGRDDNEEVPFPDPVQEHRNGLSINSRNSSMSEQEVTTSPTRHRQMSGSDTSSTRSPSHTQAPTQSRTKKAPHELLTEAEKKANHIASEQKRRQNIRIGFDSLVEIVPTLSECHRSEALILQKSVDYIQRLLSQKNELKNRVRILQANLGEPTDDNDSSSDMEVEQHY